MYMDPVSPPRKTWVKNIEPQKFCDKKFGGMEGGGGRVLNGHSMTRVTCIEAAACKNNNWKRC